MSDSNYPSHYPNPADYLLEYKEKTGKHLTTDTGPFPETQEKVFTVIRISYEDDWTETRVLLQDTDNTDDRRSETLRDLFRKYVVIDES